MVAYAQDTLMVKTDLERIFCALSVQMTRFRECKERLTAALHSYNTKSKKLRRPIKDALALYDEMEETEEFTLESENLFCQA